MGCLISCAISSACSLCCNALCPTCCWCKAKDCCGFESVKTAKVPYLLLLFLSAILAVLLKINGFEIDLGAMGTAGCSGAFEDRCQDNMEVYRVSFSACVFFAFMALVTRCSVTIHTHWWATKVFLYVLLLFISFFIPNSFFESYVDFSRAISALYLLLQIIILINFAYMIHETLLRWGEKTEAGSLNWWAVIYLVICFLSFAGALTGIGLLFAYFAKPGCHVEQFFTSLTLIVGIICIGVSISAPVNMGLLTPSVVFLYAVYMLWDALMSVPSEMCNPTAASHDSDQEVGVIIVSLIVTAGSLTWTSWRTGEALTDLEDPYKDQKADEGEGEGISNQMRDIVEGGTGKVARDDGKEDEESPLVVGPGTTQGKPIPDPTGELLWLFHLILALAAAYLSMAITNWGDSSGETATEAPSETGWFSVWAKILSQWVTFALYLWSLTAPACRGETAD